MMITKCGAGAVPWGFLGMLALVAAAEWARAWHRLDVPGATDDWVWNHRVAATDARAYDVLCLGDSALKFGVAPTVVEARTGRRCYNLGLLAGSPVTSDVLLRRAVGAGARPSAVVIEALPHVLALDPRARSQKRWPRLLGFRDALELAIAMREPGLLGPYVVDRLLPTDLERENIRAGVMAALRGQIEDRRRFFAFHARNWDLNRGAQVLPVVDIPINAGNDYRDNFARPWACHPVNAAYLTRLLDLAGSLGIRVYWLLPPMDPEIQALCDRDGQDARFERFVREAIRGRPGLVVVDARRPGFERSEFVDWAHVNRRGAVALSESLAAELGASDRGARWVRVTPRRGPSPSPPAEIEDLNQSRIAVDLAGAVRR